MLLKVSFLLLLLLQPWKMEVKRCKNNEFDRRERIHAVNNYGREQDNGSKTSSNCLLPKTTPYLSMPTVPSTTTILWPKRFCPIYTLFPSLERDPICFQFYLGLCENAICPSNEIKSRKNFQRKKKKEGNEFESILGEIEIQFIDILNNSVIGKRSVRSNTQFHINNFLTVEGRRRS